MFKKNHLAVVLALVLSLFAFNLWASAEDELPIAAFSTNPADGIEVGTPIQFTDESTPKDGISYWLWIFGDGKTTDQRNPVHTYTSPGIYKVFFQVYDEDGIPSEMATKEFKIGERVGDTLIFVSSTYGGYSVAKIIDGNKDAYGKENSTWASTSGFDGDKWVEFHYDQPKTINTVTLYWAYNDYQNYFTTSQQMDVQIWNGEEWETIATILNDDEAEFSTVTFDKVTIDKIRFFQPSGKGWKTYEIIWVAEIEVGLAE
jgi:PKD repeat protein